MTKEREALKLALEALEKCDAALAEELAAWDIDPPLHHVLDASNACGPAITALRERLAQPEQEPVAVVSGYYGGQCVILPIDPSKIFNSNTALYTTPQPRRDWQGLTDAEIGKLWGEPVSVMYSGHYNTIRAIETKLKEKNT